MVKLFSIHSLGKINFNGVFAFFLLLNAVGNSARAELGEERGKSHHLKSHIPPNLNNYSDLGKKSEKDELDLRIVLPLNNESELDELIGNLYDPNSPSFHQFLTTAEFETRYFPTEEQVDGVKNYLVKNGIIPSQVSESRQVISVRTTVGTINEAFSTDIHSYKDKNGNSFYAPAKELQVDSSININGVVGLDNLANYRPNLIKMNPSSVRPNLGSGPGGGLSPADVRQLYNIPSSYTGAGQVLALYEQAGYQKSDIITYEKTFNLPNVSIQNVLVDGFSGIPSNNVDSSEVTLDLELMTAIAPKAHILVYEGAPGLQGMIDTYAKIAKDNRAKQISTSWGWPEWALAAYWFDTENVIFKQMVAQGQSLFAASGDEGAYNSAVLSVIDPASNPNVVGVGGTSLIYDQSGRGAHETTWDYGSSTGSGGGISSRWTIPSWQVGAATGNTLGSTKFRNVPDVALNAWIPGYAIYFYGNWTNLGGTSCAAPLWAGFTALINQARAEKGKREIGFMNPVIYALGKSRSARFSDPLSQVLDEVDNTFPPYSTLFYDIADGSTNNYYPAVTGYDDATGWGSFNGANLIKELSVF